MSQFIRVSVPASAANLGPGFDTLGLAVNLRNEVHVQVVGRMRPAGVSAVSISIEGCGAKELPTDESNVVVKAANHVFHAARQVPERLNFKMVNHIPLSSGLGSSAAAVVGGMCAANEVCGTPFSNDQILEMATALEGHPDNVAPCLLGGLTICVLDEQGHVHVVQPRVRNDLLFIFCIPAAALSTNQARRALPKTYKREDVVFSLSRAIMLTALLHGGSTQLLRTAMQDKLHQPYRGDMVPGLADAVKAAEAAGALGACFSGSGPTVMAITDRAAALDGIGKAMAQAFAARSIKSEVLSMPVSRIGARICRS